MKRDYVADRRQRDSAGKRIEGTGWVIMRWDAQREIFIEGTYHYHTKQAAEEVLREERRVSR